MFRKHKLIPEKSWVIYKNQMWRFLFISSQKTEALRQRLAYSLRYQGKRILLIKTQRGEYILIGKL
jgi:fructoselysine-6-P-deglycase FrlB-like protein